MGSKAEHLAKGSLDKYIVKGERIRAGEDKIIQAE